MRRAPGITAGRLRFGRMAVSVRLLGPLEVLFDGTPVAISGAEERALVVLLARRAGRG